MSLSGNSRNHKPYYLPLLIVISTISHFPFVLEGFGEIDATKIAVSVIDLLNNGSNAAFANFYFTDVIPLYVLYLKWFMKLLDYNYSYLPLIMNYTNAVFGTLIIIPAFCLIKQLFGDERIAFCSVLALIFSPSFFQSTIMGFPHLISFFFLLTSFCFCLSALHCSNNGNIFFMMLLSCVLLTIAFLLKSDIVLTTGAFAGFLLIQKEKSREKIAGTILIVIIAGILFLISRNLILGHSSGTTMSKGGLSEWYDYSLIIPTYYHYFIKQTKPIVYGAGIVTFFMGAVSFIFYLLKKRFDIVTFVVSWATVPIVFWLVMIGNNARHNMFTVLPLIVIVVVFFYEKAPKYAVVLTGILILGNFFITAPSSSILTPSGRLFKSRAMLQERMIKFHSSATQIINLGDNKIAVLGFFHNPHVVFEILRSAPSYKALKIGREDYKITTGDKEFVFIYFVAKPENIKEEVAYYINKYDIGDYVFSSATYDLRPLHDLGFKIKNVDIIKRSSL